MRLTKIQKFLKEQNINYNLEINNYRNNEFADINIKDDKTNYIAISEIAGNRGSTVSEIMLFYKNIKTNKSHSVSYTSQDKIIQKLKDDIISLRAEN